MTHKITFIGAGNMASSLAGGLIAKGLDPAQITLTDINESALQARRSELGVNTTRDNSSACQHADVIVLAVKPQVMADVLIPLQPVLAQRQPLLISIAAGITLDLLEKWAGATLPIVRCMPNTPSLVETGATGLFANPNVSPSQRDQAKQILGAVGLALWLESEAQLDAVTAVSGSGPAYFFLVMEAMIEAGTALGLSETVARQLTLQTALGSAQMAITSDVDVSELRRRVTSPGGTTERAIGILEDKALRQAFAEALAGASARAQELAAAFEA